MVLYEWQKKQLETPKVKKEKIEAEKKKNNKAEKKKRIEALVKEILLQVE